MLVLAPSDNLRYVLGFAPTADERACFLLFGEHDLVCLVPELNAPQLHGEAPKLEFIRWPDGQGPSEALAQAVRRIGSSPRRIAVDAEMRADHLLLVQEQFPDAAYASSSEVLAPLRMRKSPDEIERLRASARTTDVAMETAFNACRDSATELEVAEGAAAALRREGCEEVTVAVVAAGAHGAFPHHHSSRHRLQERDAVLIDLCGKLDGYASAITRMAHLGRPSPRYCEVHAIVEAAVVAAVTASAPGAACEDVDAAARYVIDEAGYGAYFTHRTGHCLGLSDHEHPSIVAGEQTMIEPGMVFTIEPGLGEARYAGQEQTRLRGAPAWSLPVFRGLQPFNDGADAPYHPLAVLADVSNRDKHRLLHTAAMEIAGSQARVSGTSMLAIREPSAPVLLRQASLRPLGAAQDEFELALVDEMEVNPTLLHLLKVDFDCDIDQETLLERVDGVIDEEWELEEAFRWVEEQARRVPGFRVEPRLVLANFAYAKLPMVKDIESAFDELVAHELIAAIAGDEECREAVRAKAPGPDAVPTPDQTPLADEFLVLDADSSQNYAINSVIGGESLIVRGPPGTGKSQTIANLIASLLARGEKVWFVAEKRAAIDAVTKRLDQKKLADLVLDLHGGVSSRRAFAQTIGATLTASRAVPKVENGGALKKVEKRRDELNSYVAALHDEWEPWDLSVYEIRA